MKKFNVILLIALSLITGKASGQFNIGAGLNYFAVFYETGYKRPMLGVRAGYLIKETINISSAFYVGATAEGDIWVKEVSPFSGSVYRTRVGTFKANISALSIQGEYWADFDNVILYPLLRVNLLIGRVKSYTVDHPDYVNSQQVRWLMEGMDGSKDILVDVGGGILFNLSENLLAGANLTFARLKLYDIFDDEIKRTPVVRVGANIVYFLGR